MLKRLKLFRRALIDYRRLGIGSLRHSSGGLLRYEIEERVAVQSNDIIANAFQKRLGDMTLPRDDMLHFMVFARNAYFFFMRPHFTRWVVLRARLTKTDDRVDPISPGVSISRLIKIQMCCQIGGRILASMIRFRKVGQHSHAASKPTSGATVAVVNYLGISPHHRNDLFWLTKSTASKVGKVVLLVGTTKEVETAICQRNAFLNALIEKGLPTPEILISPLDTAIIPKFLSLIRQSFNLPIDSTKTSFIDRCFLRICHLYYTRLRESYAYFLGTSGATVLTNSNPAFINAAISGAALQESCTSVFRELSVWGNWSEVYRNKAICDCFSSMSSTSKAYLKETNPHVGQVRTQSIGTRPPAAPLECRDTGMGKGFRILLLGSNIGKNVGFSRPQVIPECVATLEIKSFSQWAMIQDSLFVRVKEKKEGPGIKSIRSIVLECTDGTNDTTFGDWEETANLTPRQFVEKIDLALAIGTFYPSSLHELSPTLPKDRCLFWDIGGLTSRYPSICDVAPISIAQSLADVKSHILRLRASKMAPALEKPSTGSGSFEAWLLETLGKPPRRLR
jgi:hypothetical protein